MCVPTARFHVGVELLGKDFDDIGAASGGDKVEVVAQVRPVVQRLHDRHRTIGLLQRVTHLLQMLQSIINARPLCCEDPYRPGLNLAMAAIACNPIDDLKDADNHVIRVSQIDEILALLRRERTQQREQICGAGWFEGKLEKCVYVLLFTLNNVGHGTLNSGRLLHFG